MIKNFNRKYSSALVKSFTSLNSFRSNRYFSVSSEVSNEEKGKVKTFVKSILHGNEAIKADLSSTYSKTLDRGKYVHEKQVHLVKPEAWDDYQGLVATHYKRMNEMEEFKVKLFGSWDVEIGESLDQAVHIWEYNNYPGYISTHDLLKKDEKYQQFLKELRPMLRSRSNQMLLEFSFWDSKISQKPNGIYELRTYVLKPGMLLEWEHEWQRGLEARRQFVQPIGAWFSQIGHLNVVHHMWADLQVRKKMREAAWQVDGWAQTVVNTGIIRGT
ncbi:hypothetical protein HK099_008245 [Clydaea vesicula]|uniref:NIPSNAP domain-containing protein n=1 Tax=Clydaea vesicula TaxID=447962 RepID=A0AAD5U505_9FUNG|nr:hypothetical protein HK099_008245 [Clydaea vesicula]